MLMLRPYRASGRRHARAIRGIKATTAFDSIPKWRVRRQWPPNRMQDHLARRPLSPLRSADNCFGLDLFGRTHVASEFQPPAAKIDVGKLADRTELETL